MDDLNNDNPYLDNERSDPDSDPDPDLDSDFDERDTKPPLDDEPKFDDVTEAAEEDDPENATDENQEIARVAIDWVELEGALENNSPELHSFLHKITGDVIRVFRGAEDSETKLREMENDPNFLYVEPISSREQYRWMEEFIEIAQEPSLKDKLNIAIDGKGAFRRFKDVLVGYPGERERWFAKRSVKLRAHMTEWLSSKGVEPINTPPWEADSNYQADDDRDSENDEDTRPEGAAGTDLRQLCQDLVNLIPSRELPTAVAFLEFLRSRRGFRRSRYT